MTDMLVTSPSPPAAMLSPGNGTSARLSHAVPAVAVAMGILLFLVPLSPQLLNDPDTQWHVATGRWIWWHGTLPSTDVFSHTFAGAPWIAKEWVSQLILFCAHAVAGWRGVALVAAAAIAAAYGLLFHWLAQRLRGSVALAATLLALTLAAPHLLARPHALVLPVIVLWVTQLVASLERRGAPPPWLVLAMVCWTNMHGSFPLGLVLAGALAGEAVLLRPRGSRVAALRRWALFIAAAGLATLVSPYGVNAILVPLHIGGNAAVPFLDEWRPLAFDVKGSLALALFGLSLIVLAQEARTNAFRILAVVAIGALMIRHSRFVDVFGIVTPILIAGSLARLRGFLPSGDPVPSRGRILPITVALAMAVACVAAFVAPRPNPFVAPEAAYRTALERGVSGPVYNDYDFGGFLIDNGTRTFVDGRSDQLFGGDFLPTLQRALDAADHRDFAAILARHRVTWALVRSRSPDANHLSALPGWTKLYEDDVAAVFAVRPERSRLR